MSASSAARRVLARTLLVALLLPAPGWAQENTVDPATGLVTAAGWEQVRAHCSGCHSLNLVRQNRGDRAYWLRLIRWMQAKHGLWDLGPAEAPVVDYLATVYGRPDTSPRRLPLETTWWEEEPR